MTVCIRLYIIVISLLQFLGSFFFNLKGVQIAVINFDSSDILPKEKKIEIFFHSARNIESDGE